MSKKLKEEIIKEFVNWQENSYDCNPYFFVLLSATSIWSAQSHRGLGAQLLSEFLCILSCFQTSLPLPVISSKSPLLINFCHYFLHISVSNALCHCCSLVFTSIYFWYMLCNLVRLTSWTIWGSLLLRLHLSTDSISHLLPSPIFLHFITFKRDLRVFNTTSRTENTVAA